MENSPGQRPWFERMMAARNDPVWVIFWLYFSLCAFIVFAMIVFAFR